ncbi:MAG: ribbon-helix-helix domain-containing protein, partial [Euryarchaeota archaeon]|nr:ribbon-helix-helix domain-containing protein [Euryarchaeota archaeon]
GDCMVLKQISLTLPENLLNATKDYSKEFGYRNVQEFILELVRNRVLFENIERYQKIEQDMKRGKNVKKFSQKDAVKYLKSL